MKINRLELIERCNQKLKDIDVRAVEAHEEKVTEHREELGAWQKDKAPTLVIELRALANRASRGGPVTWREVQRAINAGNHWDSSDGLTYIGHQPPKRPTLGAGDVTLIALRDFLLTVADDEISHSSLRDVGFRHISDVFR